ncbi:MAG: hypothetical protein ACD_20C00082G0006 [uncultured bacterium]|nr:MAG: hypothetical protein ACD_20C00082G0006 [uncultured bacterium]HBH17866.1 hypothetical protein [Cyanobacteria bacterium UBA9579]
MIKNLGLIIYIFILSTFPALAQQQEKESCSKVNQEIISCNKVNNNEICNNIQIVKTKNFLKSYLDDNYNAYNVLIKNNNNIPITIKYISLIAPERAIYWEKYYRERLYNSNAKILVLKPLFGPLASLSLPLIPLMSYDCNKSKGSKIIHYLKGVLYSQYIFIVKPITTIIATPYLAVSDKIADKKAKQEATKFTDVQLPVTLNPNDTMNLLILISQGIRQSYDEKQPAISKTEPLTVHFQTVNHSDIYVKNK